MFFIITYHCTVLHGIEGDSWRPDGNEAGSHVSKLKKILLFYFFSFLVFSRCSACKNEHRKRILGRQAAKSSRRAPLIFFSRPSSASQSFWIAFWWLSWTRSRIGWVLAVGRSAPLLSLSAVAVARSSRTELRIRNTSSFLIGRRCALRSMPKAPHFRSAGSVTICILTLTKSHQSETGRIETSGWGEVTFLCAFWTWTSSCIFY